MKIDSFDLKYVYLNYYSVYLAYDIKDGIIAIKIF